MTFVPRLALIFLALLAAAPAVAASPDPRIQPVNAAVIPISELDAGMRGEVWTVFRGTEPEPFNVEVTGVIQNALGPGKSMILCELVDERVQHMGAVAGMSGSPLYIGGRFAGALSYQVQRFETVRFAGFTPAEDLLEVMQIALDSSRGDHRAKELFPVSSPSSSSFETGELSARGTANNSPFTPLSPVFTFGGVSPLVSALFAAPFAELGINTNSLGGSTSAGEALDESPAALKPGYAVGAALAVGDITLAGTGTVSQVDGGRVLAFGHPMLGLGTVEVPMTSAEIVAILPSNLSSFKIANSGQVIGTVRQDRLSAIYGEIGPGPDLVPVRANTPHRTIEFATVRHPRLTPMITATGLSQAVLGSNDAGLTDGFRIKTEVEFAEGKNLIVNELYAGSEGFKAGLASMVQKFSVWLQNPVEEVFPEHVEFTVEPLYENPTMSLDNVQVSHQIVSSGGEVVVTISLRNFQGQPARELITIPIDSSWIGEKLEIVVSDGSSLDNLTGAQRSFPVSQIRDFDAYLNAIRNQRRMDGIFISVLRMSDLFLDQTQVTHQLPSSFARIAQLADRARFSQKVAREVLWQTHIQPDKLVTGLVRKPLVVSD